MDKLNFTRSLFLILLVFQSLNLFAQNTLPDSLVHQRIVEIEHQLNRSKPGINGWWYGWLGGYSAATIGQGAVFFISNEKATKQDMALGAATTFLGAALQLLTPISVDNDLKNIKQLPDSSNSDELNKLAVAEKLFEKAAKAEKTGRSWQIHALNTTVNLGSGLITWLVFKRSVWDGLGNFVLNSVVTEAQIWTQPTRAIKDYEEYCQKYNSDKSPLANKNQPEYFVSAYPGGVALRIVF